MSTSNARTRTGTILCGLSLLLLLASPSAGQRQVSVKVSVKDFADHSRVALESSAPLSYTFERTMTTLKVKVDARTGLRLQSASFESPVIKSLAWAKADNTYILTIEVKPRDFDYSFFTLTNPFQLMIDINALGPAPAPEKPVSVQPRSAVPPPAAERPPIPLEERRPAAQPGQSLRTIVIDPGHGGLESGAKGRFGAAEKDVTLTVALKLKDLLERSMEFRVVLTRDKDIDASLESRGALANNNDAFLFISIHANSSHRRNSSGPEVYFLNLHATDEEARRLAYFENNAGELENKIDTQSADDIQMILWDMAQSAYIKQSSQLAESIQTELNALLGTANRGIKQAPFKVLREVACPAVLLEIAFLSNPDEERKLANDEWQSRFAMAIHSGLMNYIRAFVQQ